MTRNVLRMFYACVFAWTFAATADADSAADKILADSAKRTLALRSLSAELETRLVFGAKNTVRIYYATYARPRYARLERRQDGKLIALRVADGKKAYDLLPDNSYRENELSSDSASAGLPTGSLLGMYFFNPRFGVLGQPSRKTRVVGAETMDGVATQIVEVTLPASVGDFPAQTLRLWIASDGMPRRSRLTTEISGRKLVAESTLRKAALNPPYSASTFTFTPPAGARRQLTPDEALYAKLLPVGADAPKFVLLGSKGESVALRDLVGANRVILLNFWFLGCPPCRAEMPEFQKLYSAGRAKGLAIVAVNVARDSDSDVNAFFKEQKVTFPSLRDVLGDDSVTEKYGASVFPTSYLIGSNGKILFRTVGYDIEGIRGALRKAGVL